jgi:hypothetical protein
MDTMRARGTSWTAEGKLTRRFTLIAVALVAVLAGTALTGPQPSKHAPAVAEAAGSGAPLPASPEPGSLTPCPAPARYTNTPPPHPYRAGDPVCDAHGFAVPSPMRKAPARGGPRLSQADPRYNVGVSSDPSPAVYGIYAGRAVTSVSLASNTDTIYVTMHAGDGTNWTEAGWMVQGTGLASCAPGMYMIFTASESTFDCFPQYSIAPGDTIYLVVESDGVSTWTNYLWWNNAWNVLSSVQLASGDTTTPNIVIEAVTDYNGSFLSYPNTSTSGAQLVTCCYQWVAWDTSIPNSQSFADEPYCINVTQDWDNWYGWGPQNPC